MRGFWVFFHLLFSPKLLFLLSRRFWGLPCAAPTPCPGRRLWLQPCLYPSPCILLLLSQQVALLSRSKISNSNKKKKRGEKAKASSAPFMRTLFAARHGKHIPPALQAQLFHTGLSRSRRRRRRRRRWLRACGGISKASREAGLSQPQEHVPSLPASLPLPWPT